MWRWIAPLWIVAVLAGAAWGFAELQSSKPSHQQSQSASYQRAADKGDHVPQPETADDRIATYTLWLAIFSGLLVVVSAIQIRFLISADKTARIVAQAASDTANATHKALVFTNRPKLVARRFRTVRIANSQDVAIEYSIVNVGSGPAFMISGNDFVWTAQPSQILPLDPSYNVVTLFVRSEGLEPGERINRRAATSDAENLTQVLLMQVERKSKRLCVYGAVKYSDVYGTVCWMGFAREYEHTTHRFRVLDDPEYEYND